MKLLSEAYELHDTLNPKLWNSDNTLKPEVSEKLLQIYQSFLNYIEIPLNVVDVNLVGSNVSYNYNDQSDLDLHIIVNNELSYTDGDILQQLYNAKKNAFNQDFDLSINDVPVELYIEDVMSGNATNGRYSILSDEWLVEPKPMSYDLPDISDELDIFVEDCHLMLEQGSSKEIKEFMNMIYMNRKLGLAEQGEMSIGNLIFKELRNMNLLQDLRDRYYEVLSDELSL